MIKLKALKRLEFKLLMFLCALVIGFRIIGKWLGEFNTYYIFEPALLMILIIEIAGMKKNKLQTYLKEIPKLYLLCLIMGASYLFTYIMLGVIQGFGKNPFDVSPRGIFLNLLRIIPYIICSEMIRDRYINSRRSHEQKSAVIFSALIFTLLDQNPREIFNIAALNTEGAIKLIGGSLLPGFMLNSSLSRIIVLGGWKSTLIIRVFFDCSNYFFKVLPDLDWLTKAVLGIVFPIIIAEIICNKVSKKNDKKMKIKDKSNPIETAVTYITAISIVWFSVGVFPVFPTLILTGSMEPLIMPGDVVIMRNATNEEIEIGDIIQFYTGDYFVIHRVVEVVGDKYRTKGDNNNVEDKNLVAKEQIKGKYIFHVPKIGEATLYLKTKVGKPLEEVEKEYELGRKEN